MNAMVRTIDLDGDEIRYALRIKWACAFLDTMLGKIDPAAGTKLRTRARAFLAANAGKHLAGAAVCRLQNDVVPLIASPVAAAQCGTRAARIRQHRAVRAPSGIQVFARFFSYSMGL